MAKLYAEVKSDKGGRIASKGGEEYITITVRNGNMSIFDITFKNDAHNRGYLEVMSYMSGSEFTRTIGYDMNPF